MRAIILLLLLSWTALAKPPVYLVLWFDTEDYVEPAADDAALRIAQDLEKLGVRATFKVVGEKARTLEARGRFDVIRALSRHDIGFHSNYHSIQPTPSVYLRDMGWLDGAEEFERREGPGVRDIQRIFGVTPSCYGQPGSSWGPQSDRALLRMGIRVYLDEGSQVGLDEQPFWFAGMLHVFNMGRNLIRPSLETKARLEDTFQQFDRAVAELQARGGGVISTYYHPTEFVATEFWDAVNFAKGASRERADWKRPNRRTAEDSERCYRILTRYVEHAKAVDGVKFATARDLPQLYESQAGRPADRAALAAHLAARQTWFADEKTVLSAAEVLLSLLGVESGPVEGPVARRESTIASSRIARPAFERAKADAAAFIRTRHRLPAEVWIGVERLSLADFAATLAADTGGQSIGVRKGNPEMERYISPEAAESFRWAIHPVGFSAPGLLELARLQAWTLKPARLR